MSEHERNGLIQKNTILLVLPTELMSKICLGKDLHCLDTPNQKFYQLSYFITEGNNITVSKGLKLTYGRNISITKYWAIITRTKRWMTRIKCS